MKCLTEEIIASILDKSLTKDELDKYRLHINECVDCFILYTGIKSNITEMNKHLSDNVDYNMIDKINKRIIKNDNENIKKVYKIGSFWKSYQFLSVSAAACFIFLFFVYNNLLTDTHVNSFAENNLNTLDEITERESYNSQDDINMQQYLSKNKNEQDDFLIPDFYKVPNFANQPLEDVLDSLIIIGITYTIIEDKNIDDIIFIPSFNLPFNKLKDTLKIYIPKK